MKQCSRCGKTKHESAFSWKVKPKRKQSACKACVGLYTKEHHAKNRAKHNRNAVRKKKEYVERNRKFVAGYLQEHPCVDCGEANIIALTFDHVRGKKKYTIARTLSCNVVSLKTLKEEIEKCDVRCANCHNIKTAIEQNRWILKYAH